MPQRRTRKRRRVGESTVPANRLAAEAANHVWALGYEHDQTADGRVIRLLNIVAEYTREALAMHVERSIDADRTVSVLERLVTECGSPAHIRCDNGTELTSHALKDWCRFSHAEIAYMSPGYRGRTRTSKASTARSATSCSTSRSSPVWPRLGC